MVRCACDCDKQWYHIPNTSARARPAAALGPRTRSLIPLLSLLFLPPPPAVAAAAPSSTSSAILLARSSSLSPSSPVLLSPSTATRYGEGYERDSRVPVCETRHTNYALRAHIQEKYSLPGLSSCFPWFLVIQLRRGGRAWLVRVYTCIYGLPWRGRVIMVYFIVGHVNTVWFLLDFNIYAVTESGLAFYCALLIGRWPATREWKRQIIVIEYREPTISAPH